MKTRLLLIAALVALIAVLVQWRLLDREPAVEPAQATRPGYYLKDVDLEDYDADGRLRVGLKSASAVEDPASGVVKLADVAVDYHTPTGQVWNLTAIEARVPQNGRVVEFEGNVRLVGAPTEGAGPAELHTAHMTLDTILERAQSKSEVELVFGPYRIQARGMQADLKGGSLRLESDVNGLFNP